MEMALRMEGFQKDFFFSSTSILLSDPYSILNDGCISHKLCVNHAFQI